MQIDLLNMDLEAMITSSSASGFPQFMAEVCKNLEFEELLKTRLVSVTFYNFLMDKNQRSIWIQASNKVFSTFLKDAYDTKFPKVKLWLKEGWFTEDLKNSFEQEWIEVFEKIEETATIPQIIKICHLLREIENPGKFCESSMKLSFSMTWEMAGVFIDQESNLSDQILGLHVTPSMHECFQHAIDKRRGLGIGFETVWPLTLSVGQEKVKKFISWKKTTVVFRDVTTGATGATAVAPKFSDTLTLF